MWTRFGNNKLLARQIRRPLSGLVPAARLLSRLAVRAVRMCPPRLILSLIYLLAIVPNFAICAIAAELRAGVARVDLTPPLQMRAPLGGYGARMNRPAVGVHDRIFAKALLVSDG